MYVSASYVVHHRMTTIDISRRMLRQRLEINAKNGKTREVYYLQTALIKGNRFGELAIAYKLRICAPNPQALPNIELQFRYVLLINKTRAA